MNKHPSQTETPTREDIAARNVFALNTSLPPRTRPWHGSDRAKALALGAGLLACAIGLTGCPQKSAEAPASAQSAAKTDAAEQGHAEAQYNLDISYYIGDGMEKDKKEGVKWISMAAEQGLVKAKEMLKKI